MSEGVPVSFPGIFLREGGPEVGVEYWDTFTLALANF